MLKSEKPAAFILSITRIKLLRGSPAKGVPSDLCTEQIKRATLPCSLPHGNNNQELKSGYKRISLSSMRTKPSIEDPSNAILLFKTFSSCEIGTSTFLMIPLTSVNIKRKNFTFSSLTLCRIASAVIVFFAILIELLCVCCYGRKPNP